ncbi:hypothetical protein NDA16_000474 [Ustilago loliicola]|nr:hypothetical protein NDA16_000474 [Ustilago loliicola]
MGKNKGNGTGRGGGPSRGRGGNRGARGRGRGGAGGFQPFGGAGHVLGGASGSGSPSGYGSPRGGAANGRPFRGRGRGGHLSVSGQNRVGFDYSALSRGHRRDYDDHGDDDDEDDKDEDEADFAIEPPAGYKHKIKPHLENDVHSDIESDTPKAQTSFQPQNVPSASSTPQRAFSISVNNQGSSSKPRFTPRSTAPTQFPEFYTSRGTATGPRSRPPEETEDAKYLAGIPGLRRPERRQQRNAPRFGDPADQAQSPFRVPVAFVKSTGEYGDPLKGNLPPRDHADISIDPAAKHLEENRQQQPNDPSAQRHHAGLGFSNRQTIKSAAAGQAGNAEAPAAPPPAPQTAATPYTPPRAVPQFTDTTVNAFDFDHNDVHEADDRDEVNALLAAFPGSKELAPGESMFEDDAASSWTLPAFQPEAPKPTTTASERDAVSSTEAHKDATSSSATQPSQPNLSAKRLSRISVASSNDDEEIILVPSQGQTPRDTIAKPSLPSQPVAETGPAPAVEFTNRVDVAEETDFGFVLDLEGEDPEAVADPPQTSVSTSTSRRVVLGDAAPSAPKSSAASRKKQSAKRGKPRRIPREGDSDLDWGSDGPPGGSDEDMAEEEDLAAAAAGISITHRHDAEVITDPILAKAIRADRHEWGSADDVDNDITMDMVTPAKRRGGQRAKRSLANRAAASRNAAQNARSRKADQDAIVADYMENILNQGNDSSDQDENRLFSTDDMVVETVDGDFPSAASGKGKAKARRLSNKLDDKTDLDAMIRFMNGMDPQKGGRQLGFGDIEDEIHMDEVKERLTESEADSDDDEAEEAAATDANGHVGDVKPSNRAGKQEASDSEDEDLAEQLRIILEDDDEEESSEIFSESSDSDSEGDETRQAQDEDSDSDSDSDDDDDEGMFQGKNSWADEDEEFIRALSSQVGGAGIGSRPGAAPSSKRAQKKLFNAISRGDFSDLIDIAAEENEIDSDDPAYGLGSIPTARNGKRKGRKFTAEDFWAEELQQQWDKDRVSKATKKQQRLMERQAAALNPFPNTHGRAGSGKSKSTKKQAKLARKAEKREMRASLKAHSNNVLSAVNAAGSIDAVDQNLLTFGGNSVPGDIISLGLDKRFAFNMDELNQQIQLFLSEKGRNTMRCQPMDKFARAEVHALAAAYNLQSKSKGKGRDRFPTLIKTSKSGLNVDYRKVKRIVWSNAGATFGNDAGRSDFKDKGRNKKGKGGGGGGMYGVGGGTVPKNREGEEVGFGADRIGADNIGHKLLAAMGWTEGSGIGSSQGMANPVSATVKITKGGLGF